MLEGTLVVALAIALDLAFGEPRNELHPVAWLGTFVTRVLAFAPKGSERRRFAFGLLLALVVPSCAALLGLALERLTAPLGFARIPLLALALKPAFAIRALGAAGTDVASALANGDVPAARSLLRSLCSRDARELGAPALAAASVESLAENASDSVVAPLFFYALFGLPGAWLYRAMNTLDAMIGYRGEMEWLGKSAARLDDLLNLVPARLTALFLLASGATLRLDVAHAVRVYARDAGKTESPNAGRPMAMAAGLLGVVLDKSGAYVLGGEGARASAATISAAWKLVLRACLFAGVVFALVAGGLRG